MFLIDSNVYIRGFLEPDFGEELRRFHSQHLGKLALSAVVASELLVGARTPDRERALRRGLLEPFRARRRLLVPTWATWDRATAMDRKLRLKTNFTQRLSQRSFFHDMLIAAGAREIGATVITLNARDFDVLAPLAGIAHIAPWPAS